VSSDVIGCFSTDEGRFRAFNNVFFDLYEAESGSHLRDLALLDK